MLRVCSMLTCLPVALMVAAPAAAQGTFVNFETPRVKPIAVATVGGTEFLLVCNTPDDSVEIYDPNTASPSTPPTFVARVPVGQGPASVRFDPVTESFYTANYIGDSVTKVQLVNIGGLQWSVVATKPAGESPADLALSADGSTLFVTLADASRLATLNPATLDPLAAPTLMTTSAATMGVKQPRRIEVHNGASWVLNMNGGNTHAPHTGSPLYDLDIWTRDLATGTTRTAGGLGTSNAGMAFGSNGLIYVVGSMARNDIAGEGNLRLLEKDPALGGTNTGFVESWLWVVDPSTASVTTSRDLNRSETGAVVAKIRACSQPMDVVLREADGAVVKIYIATLGSDRLVVLAPNGGPASTWTRSLIGLTMTPQPNGYSRTGPRGLAINQAQTRLYCMNQLANSVSVIDLAIDTEAVRFPLQWDMTPGLVRAGRRFLYSAEFSGNQTVACSSCHVDARTDSLGWDLSNGTAVQHPIGLEDTPVDPTNPGSFNADKGIMVTQSLQGLVNHPLNVAGQDFFSNKPYHWRGDRADFTAFNGAFVNLMGATDINPSGPPKGITDTEMIGYRDFINTVMYTPNPEQAPDRVLRGTFGNAGDTTSGTGALLGLKVFHIDPHPRCDGRSCVQCHWLPEASNNRLTESGTVGGLETAAMRSLFSREGRAEEPASAGLPGRSNVMTSHFGLSHDGKAFSPGPAFPIPGIVSGPASIDRFVFDTFASNNGSLYPRFEDLVQFCREIDSGIAPSVGVTYTVTFANQALPATTAAFTLLENQVRAANCGFAVYAQFSGVPAAFYFDITGASEGYHQHGTTTVVTRTVLLTLLAAGDVLVLQGTPAGSERRIASLNGQPGTLTGAAPTNVKLQKMRPPTQWQNVPLLTKNWDPFDTTSNGFLFTNTAVLEPQSLKSVRLLQRALIQFAPGFGLTHLQHEASRRFAVAGDNIRLGARLQFRIPAPTTPGVPPPYANVVANTTLVEMNLYPTKVFVDGQRVWETAAEADPLLLYTLLLGGPAAPGVKAAVDTPNLVTETVSSPTGTYDPLTWNLFHVTVVNEDNTASAGSWQTLMTQ